jgi:hypothetical protein
MSEKNEFIISVPRDFGIMQSMRSALWHEASGLRAAIMRDRDGLNRHPDISEEALRPRLEWIEGAMRRLEAFQAGVSIN